MRVRCLLLALAATSLTFASQAHARRMYGMAGCGLGSLIIKPPGGQISAATTNATSYNQAFGISSGTSNCKTDKEQAILDEQAGFMVANMATLQKEMAQGGGETVAAFAEVLGCESTATEQVSGRLVKSYQTIFAAPGVGGVLDAAKAELSKDQQLAQQCKFLMT